MHRLFVLFLVLVFIYSCKPDKKVTTNQPEVAAVRTQPENQETVPFVWEGANIYFLLTDRFNNGNPDNDVNFERTNETGELRGFMGGDLEGITQKIEEGYFTDLGINAIWMTPIEPYRTRNPKRPRMARRMGKNRANMPIQHL